MLVLRRNSVVALIGVGVVYVAVVAVVVAAAERVLSSRVI